MKPLNDYQKKILEYIRSRVTDGVPPSVREICEATGLKSTSTVHTYLRVLEERGYITRDPKLNRSIRLAGDPSVSVPVLGVVTAGMPILAVEEIEGYVPFSAARASGRELFALRVKGDSMVNAAILDGDIVVVEKTPVARNGEIVVALIEDEATVKRFYKENGRFRLQPENDSYAPIIVNELSILGRVIACIRSYE